MFKTNLKDKNVVACCPMTNSDLKRPEEDSIIISSASVGPEDSGKLNGFNELCRKNVSKQNNEGLTSFNNC